MGLRTLLRVSDNHVNWRTEKPPTFKEGRRPSTHTGDWERGGGKKTVDEFKSPNVTTTVTSSTLEGKVGPIKTADTRYVLELKTVIHQPYNPLEKGHVHVCFLSQDRTASK